MLLDNENLMKNKFTSFEDKMAFAMKEMDLAEKAIDNDDPAYSEHLKKAYEIMQNEFIDFREFLVENINDVDFIKKLFDAEIKISEVEITKLDNNVIKISMPIITPFVIYKKKKLYSQDKLTSREIDAIDRSDFMIDILERAIVNFLKENKIDRKSYKKKTLIYVNFFEIGSPKIAIPDTDNYSYKAFTDLITGYFTNSGDGALNTDLIFTTDYDDKTHTEIYLIPRKFDSYYRQIISSDISEKKSVKMPYKKVA